MAGIDTAAMENLLAALLKEARAQGKEQSAIFVRLAKAAGLDPRLIKQAEDRLKMLGDAAEDTSKKTSKLSQAGTVVGSVLSDLAQGVMNTAGNLVSFAGAAANGTAKMSDFYAAFKDFPVLGIVASLFSAVAKAQEESLETYRSLSDNGINLGKGLMNLRIMALDLGMNFQEFTKVMKENSETFVQMGGSASKGAANLLKVNQSLVKGRLGDELLNLGYSFEEVNSLLPKYARVMGGISKTQLADTEKLTASVAAYGKELDFLARLTGESREAIQKKLEEEAREANWEAFMAAQDDETRKKLNEGLAKSLMGAGKAGADIYKAAAMGIAVQGEAGKQATSLMSEMASTIEKQARKAMNRTVSADSYLAEGTRYLATVQTQSAKGYRDNQSVFQALALSGDRLATDQSVHARNLTTLTNSQGRLNLSVEDRVRTLEEERIAAEKAAKQKNDEVAAAIANEKAMKAFGVEMNRILAMFAPYVAQLSGLIRQNLPAIGGKLREFIGNMFTEEGRKKIVDDISELLANLFKTIFAALADQLFHQSGQLTTYQNIMNALNSVNPFAYMQRSLGFDPFYKPQQQQNPQNRQPSAVDQIPRSTGSWGATGKLIENFGAGTEITAHGKEGVVTEDQLHQIMNGSAAIGANQAFIQLNNTNAEILRYIKEVADNSRKNVDATRSLSNNAFA